MLPTDCRAQYWSGVDQGRENRLSASKMNGGQPGTPFYFSCGGGLIKVSVATLLYPHLSGRLDLVIISADPRLTLNPFLQTQTNSRSRPWQARPPFPPILSQSQTPMPERQCRR